MDPRLGPLAQVFELHTRLFLNAVERMDEVDATGRPNGYTNNVAFIAGHLTESRAWSARQIGGDAPAPFDGILEHEASIENLPVLPKLEDIRVAWRMVSGVFVETLGRRSAADLDGLSGQGFPGVGPTRLESLGFLLHHEAYHIGQLGYLRKFLGLPAMQYR